jgi:hypothetical protein
MCNHVVWTSMIPSDVHALQWERSLTVRLGTWPCPAPLCPISMKTQLQRAAEAGQPEAHLQRACFSRRSWFATSVAQCRSREASSRAAWVCSIERCDGADEECDLIESD